MNKSFLPGSLMVVKGHMDCTYRHSPNRPKLFSGLPYHDPQLIDLALASGKEMGIKLELGNYCWTLGPSYETPAEIIDMKNLGGDAVGMSTVPEIISAAELNMRVLTISCLTNYAAGITKKSLSHEEVMETAEKSSKEFSQLLKKTLSNLFDSF
jgi:purine-nucleoside phosphorylase